jgi:hypothetical protein
MEAEIECNSCQALLESQTDVSAVQPCGHKFCSGAVVVL